MDARNTWRRTLNHRTTAWLVSRTPAGGLPGREHLNSYEMTWNFSGPDGRATWEWVTVIDTDGRHWPAVRWRRLGAHRIFREP